MDEISDVRLPLHWFAQPSFGHPFTSLRALFQQCCVCGAETVLEIVACCFWFGNALHCTAVWPCFSSVALPSRWCMRLLRITQALNKRGWCIFRQNQSDADMALRNFVDAV